MPTNSAETERFVREDPQTDLDEDDAETPRKKTTRRKREPAKTEDGQISSCYGPSCCIAALDAALARLIPRLTDEQLPALRALMLRLTANFTKGNGLELPLWAGPERRGDSVRGADA